MLKKIAIIGPESTGKSDLTENLAAYYNCLFVPETARSYLSGLGRPYNQNDLLQIAKKQKESIGFLSEKAVNYLFIDTELLVIKIWSEFKYNSVHPWILQELAKQDIDFYLLTDIDIPWVDDPLREHPHLREKLLNIYKNELNIRNLAHQKISGSGNDRTFNAINSIDNFFKIA